MPRRDNDFDDGDDRSRRRRRPRDEDDDDRPPPRRKKKSNAGLIIGILVGVFVLVCGGGITGVYLVYKSAKKGFDEVVAAGQEFETAEDSEQDLLRIGKAIHTYENAHAALPNNSYSQPGKQSRALLSWRVHILPFLNEDRLYRQFNLSEPWDGPTNRPLLSQMPAVYGSPAARAKAGDGKTFYRGFSQQGAIFEKPRFPGASPDRIRIAAIPDGTTNTIMVVDAGEAVEWTRPDDLDFSPGRPRPALGGAYPNVPFCKVLFVDGSVQDMRKDVPERTLRLLVDRQDGNVIPDDWEP